MRSDGRNYDEIRKLKIIRNYIKYAEGSALIEMGDTRIICTATVDENVPQFKKNSGEGWITAEYSMLPRATKVRNVRDINKLRLNGRSLEIQRLIGRSLRAVVDFKLLGERQITIDCDVIQADGGTRTAAITGSFIALTDACKFLIENGIIAKMPVLDFVGAVSVGIVNDAEMLDLCFEEDSNAIADMNVVMSGDGRLIEIQATGEKAPFDKNQFDRLLTLAEKGINEIIQKQKEVLGDDVKLISGSGLKVEENNCCY